MIAFQINVADDLAALGYRDEPALPPCFPQRLNRGFGIDPTRTLCVVTRERHKMLIIPAGFRAVTG